MCSQDHVKARRPHTSDLRGKGSDVEGELTCDPPCALPEKMQLN